MRRRNPAWICATGLGVALLAGCGSSSPAARPAALDIAAPSASPASLAQLRNIVLRAEDLPLGWEGVPYKADPKASAISATMVKCVGARNTDSGKVSEAHSATFTLNNARISSSAASYRSQSDPDSDVAMMHSPKVSSCFQRQLTKQIAPALPAGATIESASMHIALGSAGGPSNVVAVGTGTVTVAANGHRIPLYVSTAFITGPLIEAEVDAFNVGTPVPASVVRSLVAFVATRVSAR